VCVQTHTRAASIPSVLSRWFVKRILKTPSRAQKNNQPLCEISILAGGSSSRMGRNKASLRLGRRTLLGHARAGARDSGLPHRVIRRDLVPRCGPLGGIYTALVTSQAEIILFLPCDMPFISGDLLKALVRRLNPRNKALFVKQSGRVGFPFLLRRVALVEVEQQLARKQSSLQKLAKSLQAQSLRLPRDRAGELFNVNTPDDWKIARDRWRSQQAHRKRMRPF